MIKGDNLQYLTNHFVLHLKTIAPLYFYQPGDNSARSAPVDYIRANWGDKVKSMTDEQLQVEASTLVMYQKECLRMAFEDLSYYTSMMARILDVKQNVLGIEAPVLDRNGWNESLLTNQSDLQIQKWLFAWMYVRSNYTKLITKLKNPDVSFEKNLWRSIT